MSLVDDFSGGGLCSWIPQDGQADPQRSHPNAVAESSALQAIPLPPADYTCRYVGDSIHLSQMQVETVSIAMSALLRRGVRDAHLRLETGRGWEREDASPQSRASGMGITESTERSYGYRQTSASGSRPQTSCASFSMASRVHGSVSNRTCD